MGLSDRPQRVGLTPIHCWVVPLRGTAWSTSTTPTGTPGRARRAATWPWCPLSLFSCMRSFLHCLPVHHGNGDLRALFCVYQGIQQRGGLCSAVPGAHCGTTE